MRKLLLLLLLLFSGPIFAATYDPSLPADDSFISSFPVEARGNFEGLRTGQVVDAGLLASLTADQLGGELFTCVASTTSVPLKNASGTNCLLGSATGTHNIFISVSNHQIGTTTAFLPFGCSKTFSVWVGTTTEILGEISILSRDTYSTSRNWDIGIATSSTRGEIIYTASSSAPYGATYILRQYVNTAILPR